MVSRRGGKEQNQKLHCPFLANVYPYVQITKNTYLEIRQIKTDVSLEMK